MAKLVRYGIYASLAASGVYSAELYRSNEYNSLGIVRFGRAAFAVERHLNLKYVKTFFNNLFLILNLKATTIAADYKWNLYNANEKDNDYESLISKVISFPAILLINETIA